MNDEVNENICLSISPTLKDKMDRCLISQEDAHRTIRHCESTGRRLLDNETGELVGHRRDGAVTYWVRYRSEGGGYTLTNIYSHRALLNEDDD